MAVTQAIKATTDSKPGSEMERLLKNDIAVFCQRSDEIIQRGYDDIIRGQPTADCLDAHRRELQWSLRLARLFRRVTAAGDFCDAPLAGLIEARLRQLEEHWRYVYEAPSKEEAEKLDSMLKDVFPDEPRA